MAPLGSAVLLYAWSAIIPANSAEADPNGITDYDLNLCASAQKFIVNANDDTNGTPFVLNVLSGTGDGFHNIQMDAEAEGRVVTIATTVARATVDGEQFVTHVSCKMVNRERVNKVLKLDLQGPARSCRNVNEKTYQAAFDSLTSEQRQTFESKGKPLRFIDDYVASSGGEWIPSSIDDYIKDIDDENGGFLEVQAPSVQVPWDDGERQFFQGTHHCKLITAASMRRWMVEGGLEGGSALFPRSKPVCDAPTSMTSRVGSCRFYFAPSQTTFCKDYSGAEWTAGTAAEECSKRHASREAVLAAANKYEGEGGLFSASSCRQRADAETIAGTCVFNCKAGDEALWHTLKLEDVAGDTDMARGACDLYIDAEPSAPGE